MKILVLGTCQAVEIAKFIKSQRPDCDIHGFEWPVVYRSHQVDKLRRSISSYDVVFAQPNYSKEYNNLADEIVAGLAKKIFFFPIIAYTGFHPDCVYITGSPQSPLGDYNSLIAAAGFYLGLGVERTESLYNAYIYGKLGYFNEAALANAYLDERGAEFGFDLQTLRLRWEEAGVFMLTINHPRGQVLADLTRLMMDKAGIENRSAYPMLSRSQLDDGPIWPVYPELASAMGREGSLVFRSALSRLGLRRDLSLRSFIAESFEAYERFGRERFNDPRVVAAAQILKSCLVPRHFPASSFGSVEIRSVVRNVYLGLLHREADAEGIDFYEGRVRREGADVLQHVIREMASSDEAVAVRAASGKIRSAG